MRLVTGAEYAALDRPALEWIVPGFLPMGVLAVLLGEPFAGKSYLALDLAYRVARGEPFFGQPTRQGPVLYLNLDAAEASWRERLHSIAKHGEDISGPMMMLHPDDDIRPCDIMSPSIQYKIKEAIRLADPILIIIDVLRELHNKKEESSNDMKLVGDALLSLTKNRALLCIHHTTKISNKDFVRIVDLSRGSSYITGKAETAWCFVDNNLHILPRFTERVVLEGVRRPSGFWGFPALDPQQTTHRLLKRSGPTQTPPVQRLPPPTTHSSLAPSDTVPSGGLSTGRSTISLSDTAK